MLFGTLGTFGCTTVLFVFIFICSVAPSKTLFRDARHKSCRCAMRRTTTTRTRYYMLFSQLTRSDSIPWHSIKDIFRAAKGTIKRPVPGQSICARNYLRSKIHALNSPEKEEYLIITHSLIGVCFFFVTLVFARLFDYEYRMNAG